ncbi:MAG: tetratricopeptide repeat family protein, partial [Rhizobacter sp.]|nr:tetratricopeptide repeat family protein [Rhizobacter sp.]
LRQAQAWCDESGDAKQRVYVDSMIGRALLLTGRLDEAADTLERCIRQARSLWTAFLPWPQSFGAEIDLKLGRLDQAADRFEQAFALGCQLADPCWEGVAGRGLGLVARARGDTAKALSILVDTLERCMRLPDAYAWAGAYVLDSLCEVAIERADPKARDWVDRLMLIASRAGMRELVVRAHRHRAMLGDSDASAAARLLASDVSNHSLAALVHRP